MNQRNITHCLWQSEFFSVLTEKELSYIAKRGSIEKYAAGDTIYEQGQPGKKFYLLYKGQVSLLRYYKLDQTRTAHKDTGKTRFNLARATDKFLRIHGNPVNGGVLCQEETEQVPAAWGQ